MQNIFGVVAVLLILAGVTAVIIGAARYFFPMLEQFFPESFKKPLSFQWGSYYLLGGVICLLLAWCNACAKGIELTLKLYTAYKF